MKRISFFACFVAVLCLAGCTSFDNNDFPPVPREEENLANFFNKDFEIFLRPSRNTFKIKDVVVLDLHLKADMRLTALQVDTIYLLDEKNQMWIKVSGHQVDDGGQGFLVNEATILDEENPNSTIIIQPTLGRNEESTILIIVKGNILNSVTENVWTRSYVIVTLLP